VYVCPDAGGATNWASPSYDAKLKLFFVPAKESCATYTSKTKDPVAGDPHTGSGPQDDNIMGHPGAIRALDPTTGDLKWEFPLQRGSASAGVLSTAGGVLFASSADGHLIALESRTGKPLWHYQTGAEIRNSPISYAVDGKQYIALAGSTTLLVFCLP
jgi:alcohol dehydrogenase (cytochrome c)